MGDGRRQFARAEQTDIDRQFHHRAYGLRSQPGWQVGEWSRHNFRPIVGAEHGLADHVVLVGSGRESFAVRYEADLVGSGRLEPTLKWSIGTMLWCNPHRRHTSIGSVSPIDYENADRADQAQTAALSAHPTRPETKG